MKNRVTLRWVATLAAVTTFVAGGALLASTAQADDGPECNVMFDDFAYSGVTDPALSEHGWSLRSEAGGPGVPGAQWTPGNVTFDTVDGASVVQLTAATNGTPEGTSHAEIYQSRRFGEGTYAARVRFADAPAWGNDGDGLVQAFFTITPLDAPMDPQYGELDFEYLPNGGWGRPGATLFTTTWETYRPEPWEAVNTSDALERSMDGWHDLVVQVAGGQVSYFVDGAPAAVHGGDYYPETPMSINVNTWFIDLVSHSGGPSAYRLLVDHVYYLGGTTLSPQDVGTRISALRAAGLARADTVGADTGCAPAGSEPAPPAAPPAPLTLPAAPAPPPSALPQETTSPSPSEVSPYGAEPHTPSWDRRHAPRWDRWGNRRAGRCHVRSTGEQRPDWFRCRDSWSRR